MKNTIGVLLVATAALTLLLFTCAAPDGDDPAVARVGTSAEAPAAAPGPGSRTEGPDAAPPTEAAPRAVAGAVRPDPATAVPEARTEPEEDNRAGAARTVPARRAAPIPVRAARPAVRLPVAGVEALLAVSPRALEGGAATGVLLVPADSLRDRLRIPLPELRSGLPADYTRGQPASTINTPTAYGQRLGDVYAGVGYQNRIRYDDWRDGVASVGLGLGDPERYVGLDVSVNLLDTYTEFGTDRSLSLKLHRRLPFRSAVAAGHENVWRTDGTDGGSSRYVVLSKVVLLRTRPTAALGSVVVNAGLGTDRFLPELQFARGEEGVNAFGSIGVRVLPPVNAVANWTGQDLALGLSIAPVRTWPLVLTPAVVDVTGRAGDGARFAMSAGLNYRFRR